MMMISLSALPLKTSGPEFSLTWLIIVFLLLAIWIVVKWRDRLLPGFSLIKKVEPNECELERVSVLGDAKVMRVKYQGKEALVYSDQNGVIQLSLNKIINDEQQCDTTSGPVIEPTNDHEGDRD